MRPGPSARALAASLALIYLNTEIERRDGVSRTETRHDSALIVASQLADLHGDGIAGGGPKTHLGSFSLLTKTGSPTVVDVGTMAAPADDRTTNSKGYTRPVAIWSGYGLDLYAGGGGHLYPLPQLESTDASAGTWAHIELTRRLRAAAYARYAFGVGPSGMGKTSSRGRNPILARTFGRGALSHKVFESLRSETTGSHKSQATFEEAAIKGGRLRSIYPLLPGASARHPIPTRYAFGVGKSLPRELGRGSSRVYSEGYGLLAGLGVQAPRIADAVSAGGHAQITTGALQDAVGAAPEPSRPTDCAATHSFMARD